MFFGFFDEEEGEEIEYSHQQRFDDRRGRTHADVADGFSDDKAAEEGLNIRERISVGDIN